MTFFRSAGRLSYFFWLMTKIVVAVLSAILPVGSAWYLVSSWIFRAGTTSHGSRAPSITPLARPSVICGAGMPTGVAPSAASILLPRREGVRTFSPFRSSSALTCLLRKWSR